MKEIPLTQGKVALVDDEDYDRLMAMGKWYAHVDKNKNTIYARRTQNGKTIRMHRIILNIIDDGALVDHENGNGLDNRRKNLRMCTKRQNNLNVTIRKNNTSGFKGVVWQKDRRKWQVQIRIGNGVKKHIGHFVSITEAARAYNEAAIKYHGEFAKLNQL